MHVIFPYQEHRRLWHGLTIPLFSNFLFTNLFSINFLISLLFHLFFLILTCSCQYSYNLMLTSNCMCRHYIDTNNPQGMQLGRFKNRSPARFEYIYCTLFPLCHSNQDIYPFLKKRIFQPLFLIFAYDSSVLQNFNIFTHLLPNFSCKP